MAGTFTHGSALYRAPRCRVCGRGASDVVDLGGAVCDSCLRRMNADPQVKRRVMLGVDIFEA
jgi:hypothetical protein